MLALAAFGIAMLASNAMAQRFGGGAVAGGMRGAVVGGMFGGSQGAATGAKIGVVTGATRAAINREGVARGQFYSTADYQNAPRSNFYDAAPEVFGTTESGAPTTATGSPTTTSDPTKPSVEAVIRKDDKPVVGVTFPGDWNQKTGSNFISAVSPDGQVYSMIVLLKGVEDQQAGIKKVETGLAKNYLTDVKFDEPRDTKGGAKVMTGTGKGKKSGVDVVFAAGVFDAGDGQYVGAAFVADSKIEDHYKETVKGICQTIRRAKDFQQ
jgi:hypothetical protein